MHGKTLEVINQSPGIVFMNGDFCLAHMGNFFYVGSMIKVAVSQDNGVDLVFIGLDSHRHNTRINENRTENIGICIACLFGNPPDTHTQ